MAVNHRVRGSSPCWGARYLRGWLEKANPFFSACKNLCEKYKFPTSFLLQGLNTTLVFVILNPFPHFPHRIVAYSVFLPVPTYSIFSISCLRTIECKTVRFSLPEGHVQVYWGFLNRTVCVIKQVEAFGFIHFIGFPSLTTQINFCRLRY
jgi:hypothetical protein